MKKQGVAIFFWTLVVLGVPILASATTQSHLDRSDPLSFSEEYNNYDEAQRPTEIPLPSPNGSDNAAAGPAEIPEEVAEANQSGSDLMEPLSKITQ